MAPFRGLFIRKFKGSESSARVNRNPLWHLTLTPKLQIFCRDVDTNDELFLDRLYEACLDDATVFFKDGYVCLDLTRESDSAESAVISAIKDFENAGIEGSVERVEPEDLASLSEVNIPNQGIACQMMHCGQLTA